MGVKYFFTGKPCRREHISKRYTSSGACWECAGHTRDNDEAKRIREEARGRGDELYFTGIPCIRGHTCGRKVSTTACILCHKITTQKWRKDNPEKYKKQKRESARRCYETRGRAYSQKYAEEHREQLKQKCKDHYKNNKEYYQAKGKEYYKNNAEKSKAYTRAWKKSNPEKNCHNAMNYYAKVRGAEGKHTIEDWKWLCAKFDNRCLCCGNQTKMTKDHIVPPDLGGSDYIENIQPLCISCNSSKNQKTTNYYPADIFLLYPSLRQVS